MKRVVACALVAALFGLGLPLSAAAGPQSLGSIAGTARNAGAQPLANATVRLRNVATGKEAGTTKSDRSGAFMFTGVSQGNYVIEVVNAAGKVIAASSTTTLTTGAMTVSGITLTASAAGAAAGAVAAAGSGSFFTSTAGVVLLAAAGVGATTAIVVAAKQSSPTK